MTVETVPIDSITPDPSNLRQHPEKNLTAIRGSLTRFGQQRPIIVDPRGIIIAGNGTWQSAKSLGWTEIKIVRTTLTGAEATSFAIADNRAAELAEWDQHGLNEVLAALQGEDEGLATATGFSLDEIASMLGTPEPEPAAEAPPEDFPTVDESLKCDHRCPKCGYEWSGKAGD